ncbi:acyl carrier protein [Clostridia bacterium]|nr:acyl carrier protein [Clostridia bacterium]
MSEVELTKRIMAKLTEVFRDVFDDEKIVITAGTTASDIEMWDSLNHITLIAAAEDVFGFRFKMSEVSGMQNVGEMAKIIRLRGKINV